MGLYRKIQFYKTLLIVFWCVNILLITATFIAGFRFFRNSQSFEDSLKNQKQVLSIIALDSELTALSSHTLKTEDDVFQYRKRMEQFKTTLKQTSDLPKEVSEFAQSPQWKLTPTEWTTLRTQLLDAIKSKVALSESNFELVGQSTRELFFLGLFTLFFGIVLPLIAFALLAKSLMKAKSAFEERLSVWLAQVLKKIPADNKSPWANPVFWLEVILAAFEIFAPKSRHPIILVLKDFIPTVRDEFTKAKAGNPNGQG